MSDSASAAQLRALLSEHARRANRYLLVSAVSGMALGGAVAFGLAAQVGPEPVWRYPLVYILWAITLGSVFWIVRRRWWTVASAAYMIDRAHDCDNLLRAAWLGMQRPQPGAFLEVNLRRACLAAAQFRPAPPWPLRAWYAGRDWAYTHKKTLLNGLFYLLLLLLFLLWLYFLLSRASQDARRNSGPRTASGSPSPQGSDRAGSAGERTPSGSSPPAGTSPTERTTPAGRPGSSATKAADAGARPTHAQDGARRPGAGPVADRKKTAGAGSEQAARGGDGIQKGDDASGAAAANRPGETNSDRPGTASLTHSAGGTAPAADGDRRLIVMPGMNTAGSDAQHSAAPRAPKNMKTSAQQQEAEEVRPPGRIPREYERFLRNP